MKPVALPAQLVALASSTRTNKNGHAYYVCRDRVLSGQLRVPFVPTLNLTQNNMTSFKTTFQFYMSFVDTSEAYFPFRVFIT